MSTRKGKQLPWNHWFEYKGLYILIGNGIIAIKDKKHEIGRRVWKPQEDRSEPYVLQHIKEILKDQPKYLEYIERFLSRLRLWVYL